jgi:hypothetical protein
LEFVASAAARRLLLHVHHELAAGDIVQWLHGCRRRLKLRRLPRKQVVEVMFRALHTGSIFFAAISAFSGSIIKAVVIGVFFCLNRS